MHSIYLTTNQTPIYICDINVSKDDFMNVLDALFCEIMISDMSVAIT